MFFFFSLPGKGQSPPSASTEAVVTARELAAEECAPLAAEFLLNFD